MQLCKPDPDSLARLVGEVIGCRFSSDMLDGSLSKIGSFYSRTGSFYS